MLPDQVSNPGSLTYESGALPIALRGPANLIGVLSQLFNKSCSFYMQLYYHLLKAPKLKIVEFANVDLNEAFL